MAELVLAKVTRKGQLTIAKDLRKALGIEPGDYVALRLMTDGVLISKATISSQGKTEDALPHLPGPSDRRTETRRTPKDREMDEAVAEIEEEVYRESTGG